MFLHKRPQIVYVTGETPEATNDAAVDMYYIGKPTLEEATLYRLGSRDPTIRLLRDNRIACV